MSPMWPAQTRIATRLTITQEARLIAAIGFNSTHSASVDLPVEEDPASLGLIGAHWGSLGLIGFNPIPLHVSGPGSASTKRLP